MITRASRHVATLRWTRVDAEFVEIVPAGNKRRRSDELLFDDDRANAERLGGDGGEEAVARIVTAFAELEFVRVAPARFPGLDRLLRFRRRQIVGEDDHRGDKDGACAFVDAEAGISRFVDKNEHWNGMAFRTKGAIGAGCKLHIRGEEIAIYDAWSYRENQQ